MILFPPVDVVYRAAPLKFSYLWYESSLFSLSSSKTRMSSVLPSLMEDCDDRNSFMSNDVSINEGTLEESTLSEHPEMKVGNKIREMSRKRTL